MANFNILPSPAARLLRPCHRVWSRTAAAWGPCRTTPRGDERGGGERGEGPPLGGQAPVCQRFARVFTRVTREAGWWLGGARVGSGWTRPVARVRTVADPGPERIWASGRDLAYCVGGQTRGGTRCCRAAQVVTLTPWSFLAASAPEPWAPSRPQTRPATPPPPPSTDRWQTKPQPPPASPPGCC